MALAKLTVVAVVAASARMAHAKACCWCDDGTPADANTIVGSDGQSYSLVFSDEFNKAGRTFANGDDAKWTALDIGDTSNQGAAFYLPSQATITADTDVTGEKLTGLLITTENASHTGNTPTGETDVYMPFKSAMLQTWNKFCFQEGAAEVRAEMPGNDGSQEGLWPAFWLMGNLGRATFEHSTDGFWPYIFDECVPLNHSDCDANQCSSQKISACEAGPGSGFNW